MNALKILFSIVFVTVLFTTSFVSAYEKPLPLNLNYDVSMWSGYLIKPGKLVSDKAVLWQNLNLGLPGGFYGNFWQSIGLDDGNIDSNFADEIQYTAGWAGGLKNVTGVDLKINMGIDYSDFVKFFNSGGDMLRGFIDLRKTFALAEKHSLNVMLGYDRFAPIHDDGPKAGSFFNASIMSCTR